VTCEYKLDLPIVAHTAKFNGFTKQKYNQYIEERVKSQTLSEDDPACYFELNDPQYSGAFKLTVPRYGKYVLVKLLRSRNQGENVDVQFIGFKGFTRQQQFADGSLS